MTTTERPDITEAQVLAALRLLYPDYPDATLLELRAKLPDDLKPLFDRVMKLQRMAQLQRMAASLNLGNLTPEHLDALANDADTLALDAADLAGLLRGLGVPDTMRTH